MTPKGISDLIEDLGSNTVEAMVLPSEITPDFVQEFFKTRDGPPFVTDPLHKPVVVPYDEAWISRYTNLKVSDVNGLAKEYNLQLGDSLIFQPRRQADYSGGSTSLGRLRIALHKAAVANGLIERPEGFNFLWVTDFPLFSPTTDGEPGQGGQAGLSSTHHPFTAPKTAEDVDLLDSNPQLAKAAHYDLVVNGVELGGGRRRIHIAAGRG
jgi:aspartyl-tRNA synthetase